MADLESRQANLRDTLLHISGAIQVLEELNATVNDIGKASEKTGQSLEKATSQKAKIDIGFQE